MCVYVCIYIYIYIYFFFFSLFFLFLFLFYTYTYIVTHIAVGVKHVVINQVIHIAVRVKPGVGVE